MLRIANPARSLFFTLPALLLPGALLGIGSAGCHSQPPVAPTGPAQPVAEVQAAIKQQPPAPPSLEIPKFDGDAAYASLKKQCDFGVRPIGSQAHEKCLAYLLAEMRKYADETITQKFDYKCADGRLPNTNVIGIIYPAGSNKPSPHPVLLMAHWDTRPIADGPFSAETKAGTQFRFASGVWRPKSPIMGADDAASGVAVLLELAKMFHKNKPRTGVILLLDDGEDYGDFRANNDSGEGVELGARYFAEHYKENPTFGQPAFGILLDMVGATNAFFPRETISDQNAKRVNDRVYSIARDLGYGAQFPEDKKQSVGDDHVSINEHGIPTIDLIHPLPFYPYDKNGYIYWHTTQDTADKCSAQTLKMVGEVVAKTVYLEEP